MQKKGGLQAFINKNKSKKKAPASDEKPQKADTETGDADIAEKSPDALPQQASAQVDNRHKGDSSDEELDETEVNMGTNPFGIMTEGKNETKNPDELQKKGYGLEDPNEPNADAKAVPQKQKKTVDQISFGGGKPKFGKRNKPKFAEPDAFDALDALDDEDEGVKTTKKQEKNTSGAAAEGQANPEKKKEEKGPGVKPTFKGKLNLTKTGDGADNPDTSEGVRTNYGFAVKYKTEHHNKDEKQEEHKAEEGGAKPEPRKDRRNKERGPGQGFGGPKKFDDDLDDGFQLVTDKDRKRKQRRPKQDDSDNDDDAQKETSKKDDDGFVVITQGGGRGAGRGAGRGRGGGFRMMEDNE